MIELLTGIAYTALVPWQVQARRTGNLKRIRAREEVLLLQAEGAGGEANEGSSSQKVMVLGIGLLAVVPQPGQLVAEAALRRGQGCLTRKIMLLADGLSSVNVLL